MKVRILVSNGICDEAWEDEIISYNSKISPISCL